MKANSMSICIPSLRDDIFFCNKNCPYCVSRMTGNGKGQVEGDRFENNLKKARTMAIASGVNSIVLTGKTEPTLNLGAISIVCDVFRDFPIEIQTNGILLDEHMLNSFEDWGIDTIAVSIDSYSQLVGMKSTLELISGMGFNSRITVNLTDRVLYDMDYGTFEDTLKLVKTIGINQLSFRRITIPNYAIDTPESIETQKWIKNNVDQDKATEFLKGYTDYLENSKDSHFLYNLAFGAKLYMVDGISCTHFEYCIQDDHSEEDIRSLIYYEDGHLSSTWYGSNHGRLF